MNRLQRSALVGCAVLMAVVQIQAAPLNISLAEYAFNIDGAVSDYLPPASPPAAPPGGVNLAAFDTTTGLGTVSIRVSGAGSHHVGLFLDHEIDEAFNTFFNEYGGTSGSPSAGQSWEIDEPGFRLANPGDIFANFGTGSLDGGNGVPATAPDDVSMAMAWDFLLGAGETATVRFLLSDTAPGSGFYLAQTDPDSQLSVYFSSAFSIQTDGQQLPEPASMALAGLALLGSWAARRLAGVRPASPR